MGLTSEEVERAGTEVGKHCAAASYVAYFCALDSAIEEEFNQLLTEMKRARAADMLEGDGAAAVQRVLNSYNSLYVSRLMVALTEPT